MVPSAPPAIIVPATRAWLYFRFSIGGMAITPTITSAAPMMPVQAAMMVHIRIVVTARPLRIRPVQRLIVSKRILEILTLQHGPHEYKKWYCSKYIVVGHAVNAAYEA